jgi:hypothetical protein
MYIKESIKQFLKQTLHRIHAQSMAHSKEIIKPYKSYPEIDIFHIIFQEGIIIEGTKLIFSFF